MKKFLNTLPGKFCLIAGVLLLLIGLVEAGYSIWLWNQPKFQDLTMELGEPVPPVEAFLTEYGQADKARLLTQVTPDKAGTYEVRLAQGRQEQTVTLTVVDTTAPTVTFQDLERYVGYVPAAGDFVESAEDFSPVTAEFVQPVQVPADLSPITVEVVVTDASGNQVSAVCRLSFRGIRDSYTLELGDTLEKSDVLLDGRTEDEMLSQAAIDAVNAGGVGTYVLEYTYPDHVSTCTVTVEDTTGPVLELKPVEVYQDENIALNDFLVSAQDLSGEVTVTADALPETKKVGTYTVTVEARDIWGNITSAQTELTVKPDLRGPDFSGMGTLTVEKNSTPDYTSGVKAYDTRDGEVKFTYDDSRVDLTKWGTYYVSYTATDRDGNKSTYRRKVVVKHDAADRKALVKEHAEKCGSSDPEKIRDYVRNNIYYSSSWGGSDPVWYGFTENRGNCYVHAKCLQALLQYYGHTVQVIHTTDESHYWLIIRINGTWWHIDATPGSFHTRYSLMNDDQRHETLQLGQAKERDWDRTQWPACG